MHRNAYESDTKENRQLRYAHQNRKVYLFPLATVQARCLFSRPEHRIWYFLRLSPCRRFRSILLRKIHVRLCCADMDRFQRNQFSYRCSRIFRHIVNTLSAEARQPNFLCRHLAQGCFCRYAISNLSAIAFSPPPRAASGKTRRHPWYTQQRYSFSESSLSYFSFRAATMSSSSRSSSISKSSSSSASSPSSISPASTLASAAGVSFT